MTGGLLNIVSYGNQNVILNSNPKKSFFKTTYAKYTNFGLQKFRIDFTGQRNLRMSEESRFTFTVPRYAELFMDTYLVVTLPTIWSPIYPPISCGDAWRPYEFRWIENLGTQMIKEVTFSVGGQLLQRMTGKYLLAQVQRDFNGTKRFLYDTMTGNTAELNDPANFSGRRGTYPNVYYNTSQQGPEPSIRGRKLYIPLNAWFCNNSRTAFPLVALQYNELQIDVVMRPVRELFVTRDINYLPPQTTGPLTPAEVAQAPFIQPNFNEQQYQFYRFLQPPPAADISTADVYSDKRTDWNADVHLLSTYCFLSAEESRIFASQEQKYLLKSAYEWDFKNVTGSHRVELQNTAGMVATWMFMFQRSDINLRNQWSNYTNWAYANAIPDDVTPAPVTGYPFSNCPIITPTVLNLNGITISGIAEIVVPTSTLIFFAINQTITVTYNATNYISGTINQIFGNNIEIGPIPPNTVNVSGPQNFQYGVVTINTNVVPNNTIGPGVEPSGTPSGLFVTQDYNVENQREILQQLGILLNGSYRENLLESGVYNYVEKYVRTSGAAPFGLYIYNFGLDADNDTYQPSGAINMSKFSTIELEFNTYPPPLDPSANFYTICDPNSDPSVPIGVNKPQWRIYQYNYDLTVLEERYNVLTFIGGNCALMYAR
jgi:hypothetical protein